MIKIIHATLLTDQFTKENQTLYIKEGLFVEPFDDKEIKTIDAQGNYVCPGFIDIHTHGMMGDDFMDATQEAIINIAKAHLDQGATTIIPTSLAGSKEETEKFLAVFSSIEKRSENYADMPSVHLEGPYFAQSQKGAQPIEYLRNPHVNEYGPILEKYGHLIGRWSAASELENMKNFAKACKEKEILLSYAHSDANFGQAIEANQWGFTHFTHLYSCMSNVHRNSGRRFGGLVEAAYIMEDTTVELISDGMHLPPELVQLAYRNKGADHACLITDSMRAAGLGEGEYILGSANSDHKVIVKDGVAWMPGFESFAGSVSSMIQVVQIAVKKCNIPLIDAVKMATKTPAKIMNLKQKGSTQIGYDGDCLILDQDLTIQCIIKAGKVYKNHLGEN